MTHEELNEHFIWTPDNRFWDSWRRLSWPWLGDCDDYAVTALYIEAGSWPRFWWWLVSFQACFWYTKTAAGIPHMMVWRRGRGWVDNTHPKWGSRKLAKRWPAPWPLVAAKIGMGLVG